MSSPRDEFIYLDELRAGASAEHLQLVGEVYGPAWATPYMGLYEQTNAGDE